MEKRFILLFFIMASIFSNSTFAFTHPLLLKENWLLKSSAEVKETGEIISSPKFIPAGWYPITIPSTVLNALAKNGVYPDPYVGMNNMLIPDASDEFNEEYDLSQYSYLPGEKNPWRDPYWHRTEFKLPAEYTGKYCWLNFKGINYRADAWLNGNKIADSEEMVGMFRRFKFNVTGYVKMGKNNYLAVKVYPLDDPGIPALPQLTALGEFGPNGGAPPKTIGKNVTMECSAGWDWIPAVRDRNMGIWQDVYINATGPVDLRDPYIITHLPLPDTNQTSLNICVELVNVSKVSQAGVLKGIIREKNIEFEKKVEIQAGETKKVTFSSENYPQLIIKNPRLWWPNGYGEQNLNRLTLDFEIGEEISDTEKITFGIREITSEVPPGKGRVFSINGKKIFIKGGAWVPDMMLNRDKKRYADEVRLSAEANLNMIRLWGGGITPPDEFFEACDK